MRWQFNGILLPAVQGASHAFVRHSVLQGGVRDGQQQPAPCRVSEPCRRCPKEHRNVRRLFGAEMHLGQVQPPSSRSNRFKAGKQGQLRSSELWGRQIAYRLPRQEGCLLWDRPHGVRSLPDRQQLRFERSIRSLFDLCCVHCLHVFIPSERKAVARRAAQ